MVLALVALGGLYGAILRAWLLGHLALTSDEAVAGLMARGALSGHFAAFYWGQHYGGAEPYAVAAVLGSVNGGPLGLNATAAVLSALAAVLVGLAVRSVTSDGRLGALAGAVAWVWSYAVVWNSVRENGFRQVVLCAGLAALLCALRIRRRGAGLWVYAALGLAVGVGWWASPEVVYFAAPIVVVLVASWDRLFDQAARGGRLRLAPPVATALGALVGSVPWLWANAGDRFASLRSGALPSTPGQGFGYRLAVFFKEMLPMQLGVRTVPGGAWVGGQVVGPVLYGVLACALFVSVAWALASARLGRRAAPLLGAGLAVAVFPLVYAAVPSSGYWVDGRYGVLLPALIVATVGFAPAGVRRGAPDDPGPAHVRARRARVRTGLVVGCVGLAAAVSLTAAAGHVGGVPVRPAAFFSGWHDPDAAARAVDARLVAHHLRDAYGDYWTAYVLDFLDPGQVTVSPSRADVVRSGSVANTVASSPRPAWLFFAPGRTAAATSVFANTEPGPGGFTQGRFTGLLTHLGIGYRVIPLGVLDAVVPDRRVALPAPFG